MKPVKIRDYQTEPIVHFNHARTLAKSLPWDNAHLTWVENSINIDGWYPHFRPEDIPNERWEGVLNHPSGYMEQVGGPSCGPFNKRNEVDADNSGQMQFYYSPNDQRIHLFGAEVGWIKADYNFDGLVDEFFWMEDSDKDGYFDTWKYDVDADCLGEQVPFDRNPKWSYKDIKDESGFERTVYFENDEQPLIPFDYWCLNDKYTSILNEIVPLNQELIDIMKAILKDAEHNFTVDPIEEYYISKLKNYGNQSPVKYLNGKKIDFHLGEKIRDSMEGTRYYQDLIRERYWNRLVKTSFAGLPGFQNINKLYENGDYKSALNLMKKFYESPTQWMAGYKERFIIEVENPDDRWLENHPVVIDILDVKKKIKGFNPLNYILVEADKRIEYHIVASQADDLDGDGSPDELAFVYTLPPSGKTRFLCYYSPQGVNNVDYPYKTDARNNWSINNSTIGWESNRCVYRFYNGKFDFYGQRLEGLQLKDFGKTLDYHKMDDWGMDVLKVGNTAGIGGISLWEGEKAIPAIQNNKNSPVQIERTVISTGPVRSIVQAKIWNITSKSHKYSVTIRMSAYAENYFSKQDIQIEADNLDSVTFSAGMEKLINDEWHIDTRPGVFSSWGRMDNEIGDIGLGLIFPSKSFIGYAETETGRHVKIKVPTKEKITYYIVGGWRKGFATPMAPTGSDWQEEIKELGFRLNSRVKTAIITFDN